MLKTRVIPCLTVKNERLVKSVQFAEHRNIGSYIAAVRVFNARDVDELIFLDLDASTCGIRTDILREVTKECFMPVTLGGGVRAIEDIQTLLGSGADKVSLNTAAFERPELISEGARRFGSQCVVVSVDVKEVNGKYKVCIAGGQKETDKDVVSWAKEAEELGAGEILLTSIMHDGMMRGYDLALISLVSSAVTIPVIVCGGAGVSEHCVDAAKSGASAIAAASMFQYTQTTPHMVKEALANAGIPARV